MKRQVFLRLLSFVVGALTIGIAAAYDFPFEDPLVATVIGTPRRYQAELPKQLPRRLREVTLKRQVADIFWYHRRLQYAFLQQPQPAPLIFLIAGTGGGHSGRSNDILQKVFFQAGFHVVALPSPTHASFIVAASETSVPGNAENDARDLYQAMTAIYRQIKDSIEVTRFLLAGYSLGGFNSAFIAKLDAQRRLFDFQKVLMLCPPVDLYNSVNILDAMFAENVPTDAAGLNAYLDNIFAKLGAVYAENQQLQFDGEFPYRVYRQLQPGPETLAGLIGFAFRLSSVNMAFAADVMANAGFLVPRNTQLRVSTSLTPFAMAGFRTTFADYLDGIMVPYFSARDPRLTRASLIRQASLRSIEAYLAKADHIGLMTNADEIILAPGELDYLRALFGARARIYPRGGHCGNLAHRANVADMVSFFQE